MPIVGHVSRIISGLCFCYHWCARPSRPSIICRVCHPSCNAYQRRVYTVTYIQSRIHGHVHTVAYTRSRIHDVSFPVYIRSRIVGAYRQSRIVCAYTRSRIDGCARIVYAYRQTVAYRESHGNIVKVIMLSYYLLWGSVLSTSFATSQLVIYTYTLQGIHNSNKIACMLSKNDSGVI